MQPSIHVQKGTGSRALIRIMIFAELTHAAPVNSFLL
jgi:hypothetical protein